MRLAAVLLSGGGGGLAVVRHGGHVRRGDSAGAHFSGGGADPRSVASGGAEAAQVEAEPARVSAAVHFPVLSASVHAGRFPARVYFTRSLDTSDYVFYSNLYKANVVMKNKRRTYQ